MKTRATPSPWRCEDLETLNRTSAEFGVKFVLRDDGIIETPVL